MFCGAIQFMGINNVEQTFVLCLMHVKPTENVYKWWPLIVFGKSVFPTHIFLSNLLSFLLFPKRRKANKLRDLGKRQLQFLYRRQMSQIPSAHNVLTQLGLKESKGVRKEKGTSSIDVLTWNSRASFAQT